jgi:bacterial/archaeal transporter family-2 protein
METTFAVLSIAAGALLAVQAGANAQLAKATGSPFSATAIQLALGAVVLAIAAISTGQIGALAKLADAPAWHALGGIASAIYVVATILLYPRIGAVLAVGLIIAGQMLASLTLDLTGLFGVAPRAPALGMFAGAAAVLAGAVAIVRGGMGKSGGAYSLAWLALGLIAGAVLPVQGAVNGLLRLDLGAPFAVATVSFVVATIAMLLALLVFRGRTGSPKRERGSGFAAMPWWGWLGALCGASYVTTVFTAIPVIGAAATVGLTVLGQQAASLLVDQYGLLRLPRRAVSGLRFAGVVLLMAGVLALRF